MRRAPFERRHHVSNRIPTVAMGDIAFLLLIFFMATAIFRDDRGIEVRLPRAVTTEKQKQDDIIHVWIDRSGRVAINERFVAAGQVRDLVGQRLAVRPALVVAFNADERAPYRAVAEVLEELKAANAVHVSFSSEPQSRRGRSQGP